jgi:epoxyqueuosine reductase
MKDAIRQRAQELGFDDCRFTTAAPPESAPRFQRWLEAGKHGGMSYLARNAEKRADPQLVFPGAKTVICLAASYADGGRGSRAEGRGRDILRSSDWQFSSRASTRRMSALPIANNWKSEIGNSKSGFVARFARFQDYHDVLGGRLKQLAEFVDHLGGVGTKSAWCVDTGPVMERDFAQRAGLGFIGKHTNLISRQLGNWLFLAEILTTLELQPDAPEKNRCGTCARCIAVCPTGAITAPFQIDARLCISYLTIESKDAIRVELRPAVGNRIFGCDECLAVCPWNRFACEGKIMKEFARPDLAMADLAELLSFSEADFKRRFAGTPLLRAKRRGFLRNVCVALGNVGDKTTLPALERAAVDTEPLVAEHARWAIEQLHKRTRQN